MSSRELDILKAEQAMNESEDIFFDNCKYEGVRDERRIFEAGWRCGQDYGERSLREVGVVYPGKFEEIPAELLENAMGFRAAVINVHNGADSRAFDPAKDKLVQDMAEDCGLREESDGSNSS